jgi:hypothetical protein
MFIAVNQMTTASIKEGKRDRAKPDGKAGCKKTKKNGWEGFVLKYPYWLTILH